MIGLGPLDAAEQRSLVSSDTFLAIDDSVFERVDEMSLSLCEVQKYSANPILKTRPTGPDAWRAGFPWVLLDAGKYRMWYLSRDASGEYFTCYAESSDGYSWSRPALGIVEYHGNTANNICYRGHTLFPQIYHDPSAADPEHRYIGVIFGTITKEQFTPEEQRKYGAAQPSVKCLAFSPDGLHWTEDSANVFPLHAKLEGGTLYRMGDRWLMAHQQNSAEYPAVHRWSRFIAVSSSTDLKTWKLAEQPGFFFSPAFGGVIQTHMTPGYQNYGNVIVGAQGLFYDNQELIDHETDLTLILSNDGMHWRQPKPQQPLSYLLRRGERDSWDRSFVVQGNFVNIGSKTLLYYNGSQWGNVDADGIQVGVTELRLDGYGSLAPKITWSFGAEGPFVGILTSKPIRVLEPGLKLYLNVSGGADSRDEVRVELADPQGIPFNGFTFSDCSNVNVDSVGVPIAWAHGSDLTSLVGKEVKVRIRITANNPQRTGKIRVQEPQLFAFYFDRPRLWLNRQQKVFVNGLERQRVGDVSYPSLEGVDFSSTQPVEIRLLENSAESAVVSLTGNAEVTMSAETLSGVEVNARPAAIVEQAVRFELSGTANLILRKRAPAR